MKSIYIEEPAQSITDERYFIDKYKPVSCNIQYTYHYWNQNSANNELLMCYPFKQHGEEIEQVKTCKSCQQLVEGAPHLRP